LAAGGHKAEKIDALMEQASRALVERRYFEAERLALAALRKSHSLRDYERMARIALPLQEARRQKRDLAFDAAVGGAKPRSAGAAKGAAAASTKTRKARAAGAPASQGGVFVVDAQLPDAKGLRPGCYLVVPPRVGADGRILRELLDKREVPAIVIVREPETREGLWPLVALGPVTVRAKVKPPARAAAPHKVKGKKNAASTPQAPPSSSVVPPLEWFLSAGEAIGDAAIAGVSENMVPHLRVDALMERLEAVPDHEKLHQRLEEAAREAAKIPLKPGLMSKRPASAFIDGSEDDED
jgi:hypothetical protein